MSLLGAIQEISQQNAAAGQPTDYVVGTVTGVNPLEITINTAMAPLRESVLYLTSAVVEKTITTLSHSHTISGVSATCSTELESVVCTENGTALPTSGSTITINRGLQVGDAVLLLRVQNGQKFVVLSRVMEA